MNFSYRLYGLIDCRAVYSTSMKSTTAVISHAPEIASRAKFFTKPRHQQTFYCLNDPFTLCARAISAAQIRLEITAASVDGE